MRQLLNASQLQHSQEIVELLLLLTTAGHSLKGGKGIVSGDFGQLKGISFHLRIEQEVQRREVDEIVDVALFDELHAEDIKEGTVLVRSSEGFVTDLSCVQIGYDELLQLREIDWSKFHEVKGVLRGELRVAEDEILEIGHYCVFLGQEELFQAFFEVDAFESEGFELAEAGPADACERVDEQVVLGEDQLSEVGEAALLEKAIQRLRGHLEL